MSDDRLVRMFKMRERFMKKIQDNYPGIYPDWPVNLLDKKAQQALRDSALKGVEEMFEALQHLKNWKPHKKTLTTEFNRDEFLEETVDAFNYFFALLVMMGVSPDEFFTAYEKKDAIIHERLKTNY
jgi:hypothetical protein